MEKLKVASLFCGCGGTDVGLLGNFDFLGKHYASNNMEIVYANDIDDNACKIFNENFDIKPDNRDIRKINSLRRIQNDLELKTTEANCFLKCAESYATNSQSVSLQKM